VDLRDMVAQTRPGETVPVVVKRGNGERTLNVTVGTVPDVPVAQNASPTKTDAPRAKLGVSVANSDDPQVRQQLGLKGDVPAGAVVVQVIPGSPASEAGLQPGDIIQRLDGKIVNNSAQLTDISHNLKNDATVTAVVRRGKQTILMDIQLD
jgi:serine protease Do